MLLIDLSGVITFTCINLHKEDSQAVSENAMRNVAFSTLLYYKKKYAKQFGTPVVCVDRKPYWREAVHRYYKKNRDKERDKSGIDWEAFSTNFKTVQLDIKEYAPYPFIEVPRAEADDSIAVLTQYAYARREPVMIVSGDKDMIQLQLKYKNVSQYSPGARKLLTPKNAEYNLLEHILTGDRGDGIPNILSDDDQFMKNDGSRQKVFSAARKKKAYELKDPMDICEDDEQRRKFKRNRLLIDLDYIPDRIRDRIVDCYESETANKKPNRMMACVREYRLRNLLPSVKDF